MNMKKVLALALALVLIVGATVAGTVAWLMDTTGEVENTFTVGDINIDLKEHELLEDGTPGPNEVTSVETYKILPGTSQPKDPFVTVKKNSEDCYVFVQVKEVNNDVAGPDPALKYVEWAIDTSVWTHLSTSTDGKVYTYVMTTSYTSKDSDQIYNVLLNKTVDYNEALTKDMLNAVTDSTKPQLIFKAFAVQTEASGNAADAWAQVPDTDKLG